jgi:hypothetical protein
LNDWSLRNISLLGKITVIKTLAREYWIPSNLNEPEWFHSISVFVLSSNPQPCLAPIQFTPILVQCFTVLPDPLDHIIKSLQTFSIHLHGMVRQIK